MKSIISAVLLAVSFAAGASVVTQEVVLVRSDGTLTVPSIALLQDLQDYAVSKSGATVVHSNEFSLVYRNDSGNLTYMLTRLGAAYGRVWYFSGMAASASTAGSAGRIYLGNYSLELDSSGRPVLKNGETTIETIPYSSEVVTQAQLESTVNRVKDLHYDPTLQVTWTNVVNNGHIYYVTVTNTNISTL